MVAPNPHFGLHCTIAIHEDHEIEPSRTIVFSPSVAVSRCCRLRSCMLHMASVVSMSVRSAASVARIAKPRCVGLLHTRHGFMSRRLASPLAAVTPGTPMQAAHVPAAATLFVPASPGVGTFQSSRYMSTQQGWRPVRAASASVVVVSLTERAQCGHSHHLSASC